MSRPTLDPFFAPRSVAVVGASQDPSSVGYALLKNLLTGSMRAPLDDVGTTGFPGPIYAVNRKGGEILGQTAYPSLTAIGAPVDLAVVAIPGRFLPDLVDEAGALGTRAMIVISAGFSEMGEEGRALQDEMLARAQRHEMRLIGPNCLGVIRPAARLNASFGNEAPRAGHIGLLSQSGALVTGIISYAEREAFGLSVAVSLGAKADVDDVEVLEWLAHDDETRSIALYAEAFPEPRRTFEVLREVAKQKPVVALKGGLSAAGARAASSHTGALAGSAAAYEAAFAQAGVIAAPTIGDFMAWSRALAHQPPAAGKRIAIVTNAGGPGVLSADAASRHGLELAQLSEETFAQLNQVLPAVWSHGNPIDVIGDATPERYRDALNLLGRAPEVDGIVVIMTVQAMTAPRATAEAILAAHEDPSWKKPLLCSFIGLVGTDVGRLLDERGVPELNTPEEAVRAMAALALRGRFLRRRPAPEQAWPEMPAPDLEKARALVEEGRARGQKNLDLSLARDVLRAAGLRYNGAGTARDEDEAVRLAEHIGYPVVIKVVSPDVLHKSDVGGVVLDVVDAASVRQACADIEARISRHQPGARVEGFTVEEQVKGTEMIVGMSRDPGFGPLLMVGMGGVFVEVYKDVAFRLLPLGREDALEMMAEIRAQPLLDGARGRPVLDRPELAEVLLRISALVEAVPAIAELDVNPLVITERGLVAIDARVIAA